MGSLVRCQKPALHTFYLSPCQKESFDQCKHRQTMHCIDVHTVKVIAQGGKGLAAPVTPDLSFDDCHWTKLYALLGDACCMAGVHHLSDILRLSPSASVSQAALLSKCAGTQADVLL